MTLNDLKVRSLTAPDGKQRDFADDTLPGFAVRVGKRTKTFIVTIGSGTNRKRYTIGRYDPPRFTLSMAREAAKDLIARERIAPSKKSLSPTYSEALVTFYATYGAQKHRATSHKTFDRLHRCHFLPVFGDTKLSEIDTADIIAVTDGLISTPWEAHAAFAALHCLFRWAVKRRLLERSPMEGLDAPVKPSSRSRVLTPSELVQVWRACDQLYAGPFIRCLILSAQRRSQLTHLTAEMIDWHRLTITWTADQMKGGREHVLPITPMLADILKHQPDTGLVFPSPVGTPFCATRVMRLQLERVCPVRNFTFHDFRRVWGTYSAEELETPPHIVEAVLAHQSGTEVSRTYNRAKYLSQMREAMERYETWLALLLQKAQHPPA